MDSKGLAEYVDQSRWLMNNGLINDGIKNQLFMYGSVVHKDLKALTLDLDVSKKALRYVIYFDEGMLKTIAKYNELSQSKSIFGLWRFKRMLKKHGNLNFVHILNSFVKDFCGPGWAATIEVMDFKDYVEGIDGASATSAPADKQTN